MDRVDGLAFPQLIDFPDAEHEANVSLETFLPRKPRGELLPGSFPDDETDPANQIDQCAAPKLGIQLTEVQAGTHEQLGDSEIPGLYSRQGYRVLAKVKERCR